MTSCSHVTASVPQSQPPCFEGLTMQLYSSRPGARTNHCRVYLFPRSLLFVCSFFLSDSLSHTPRRSVLCRWHHRTVWCDSCIRRCRPSLRAQMENTDLWAENALRIESVASADGSQSAVGAFQQTALRSLHSIHYRPGCSGTEVLSSW